MAVVMKGACDFQTHSSCERPEFPNWAWRFNRNQHMTPYYPWQIREEQQPPQNRNMGMHRNFRFHPRGPNDGPGPLVQLGVNFCHELKTDRRPGFGNGALGRSAGPAPPRMFAYMPETGNNILDDLYKVNEIHLVSPGMSLFDYQPLPNRQNDDHVQPLNPSHYLDKTLGQTVQIPGTFPHFNKPLATTSPLPPRLCNSSQAASCGASTDLMQRWRAKHTRELARHAWERCCLEAPHGDTSRLPKIGLGMRKCQTAREPPIKRGNIY